MEFDFISLTEASCVRCRDPLISGQKYPFIHGRLYCSRVCYLLDGHSVLDPALREINVFVDEYGESSIGYPDDPHYLKIAPGLFKGLDFG